MGVLFPVYDDGSSNAEVQEGHYAQDNKKVESIMCIATEGKVAGNVVIQNSWATKLCTVICYI